MGTFIGYVAYLASVMLPGIGLTEFLKLYRNDDGLTERIALALGSGLSFSTIILIISTSGLSFDGFKLSGLSINVFYFLLCSGTALILLSFLRRRNFSFFRIPNKVDIFILSLCFAVSLILYVNFQKYPVFPAYNSVDYRVHVQLSEQLLNGKISSIPEGILYYGIHLQIALSYLLVSGLNLITAQRTVALLVALSPLIFWLSAKRILENSKAAIISAAIYSLSGSIWVGSVLNAGLYANFFGIIVSLFFLALFVEAVRKVSISSLIGLLISLPCLYFSHYTAVVVLFTVFLFPFLYVFLRKESFSSFYPTILSVTPVIGALVARPELPNLLLALAVSGGGRLIGSTPLSSLLSSYPVLSYMALEIYNDPAFILMLILSLTSIYLILKRKIIFALLPCVWLLSLLVASPFNVSAWRFSFEALVPLTILSSLTIASIYPERSYIVKKQRTKRENRFRLFLIFILVTPLIIGSWVQTIIQDSLTDTAQLSNGQFAVLNAINWLSKNTPNSSKYLSVSDWRFTYTDVLINRQTVYQYVSQPSEAINISKSIGAEYIVVTYYVTENIPPVPSLFPWNNFHQNSNLTLVYNSTDVRIFRIS
jgi:hypothetical protein